MATNMLKLADEICRLRQQAAERAKAKPKPEKRILHLELTSCADCPHSVLELDGTSYKAPFCRQLKRELTEKVQRYLKWSSPDKEWGLPFDPECPLPKGV